MSWEKCFENNHINLVRTWITQYTKKWKNSQCIWKFFLFSNQFPQIANFLSYFRTFWAKNNGTSIKLARGNSFFGICTQVEDRTWSFAWTFFLQKKIFKWLAFFKKIIPTQWESFFKKKNVHQVFLHFWKIGNVVIFFNCLPLW